MGLIPHIPLLCTLKLCSQAGHRGPCPHPRVLSQVLWSLRCRTGHVEGCARSRRIRGKGARGEARTDYETQGGGLIGGRRCCVCSSPGQEVLGRRAGGVFTPWNRQILHSRASSTRELAYSSPRVGRHGASVGSEWLHPESPSFPTPAARRPTLSLEQLLSGEADLWDLGISGARIRDGLGIKMGGEERISRWKSSSWGLKEGS